MKHNGNYLREDKIICTLYNVHTYSNRGLLFNGRRGLSKDTRDVAIDGGSTQTACPIFKD